MTPTTVREAKKSVQISSNGLFIFFNKALVETGQNKGETVYTVNINEYDPQEETHFFRIGTLFLNSESFAEMLALLCQLQKRTVATE